MNLQEGDFYHHKFSTRQKSRNNVNPLKADATNSGKNTRWEILRGYDINYGIKTGYNDAFIIDNDTKDALIAEDPNSTEILKPILRGRDIKRFRAQWSGMWIIDTHNGYGKLPPINIDDYPAAKRHLAKFYIQLEKRQDKGVTPYNLRNCAYREVFAKEKLIWMDLTERGRFSHDTNGMFCLNTAYVMSGQSVKYLCAMLNSKLINWFMSNTALQSGMGVTRWINSSVETIPIPKIPTAEECPLVHLVDHILVAKAADANRNVSATEAEIDLRVYELYGLTALEISNIEANSVL